MVGEYYNNINNGGYQRKRSIRLKSCDLMVFRILFFVVSGKSRKGGKFYAGFGGGSMILFVKSTLPSQKCLRSFLQKYLRFGKCLQALKVLKAVVKSIRKHFPLFSFMA